jgi:OOP family OmpA-OmpF porin
MALLAIPTVVLAQPSAAVTSANAKVVVSGVVADEATRQALLARTREVYGDRVVDQLGVAALATPPNWSELVQRLITADLKRVSKGQLKITGNVIELSGDVATEAISQQIVTQMSSRLNPTYTVRNGLRVPAPGQEILDASLATERSNSSPAMQR